MSASYPTLIKTVPSSLSHRVKGSLGYFSGGSMAPFSWLSLGQLQEEGVEGQVCSIASWIGHSARIQNGCLQLSMAERDLESISPTS